MKAEDTVMSPEEMGKLIIHPGEEADDVVAKARAEISFKAGEESVLLESKMGTLTVSSLINKGRREVVEKLEPILIDPSTSMGRKLIQIVDEIAKLKWVK